MTKIFLKKNKINKLILILFVLHTPIAFSEVSSVELQETQSQNQLLIEKEISIYQLALSEHIQVADLLQINPDLDADANLNEGDVVNLPERARSIQQRKTSNLNANEELSSLPELYSSPNETKELQNEILGYIPGSQYVTGGTEENLANIAIMSAEENWDDFSGKKVAEKMKQHGISKLTGEVNQQINQNAREFLGKFGKAEVSLSIDEKGKLNRPELKLFSPLIEDDKNLFFSQFGVHEQDSGKDSRMIGNFGLGYRYETEDYLTGVNTFIDHDFTGSNTRLGLGAEYWNDQLKLSANSYMPLSSWKESKVMKNHEALIYDERPAKGFDIRAKSYLPNYPQIGGSLMYEQYFGDEVALFGINKRQKDPYGLSLGIDYMPVPLVKSELTHKIGKAGSNETKVNLGLQVQLGTPIEDQLNPDNVKLARSLKGSRYDFVDRNYDIVFEYKKEDFKVEIAGPDVAVAGTQVTIDSLISSRSPIEKYEWVITKRNGEILSHMRNLSDKLNDSKLYFIMGNEDVFVRLKVTTQRGHKGISKPHLVKSQLNDSKSILEGRFIAEAINFSDYDFNILNPIDVVHKLSNNHKIEMLLTAKDENGQPVDVSELNSLALFWKEVGSLEFESVDTLKDQVKFFMQRDINNPTEVKIYAIADRAFIGALGGTKSIDFAIVSTQGLEVNAQQLLTFTSSDSPLMRIGVDPQNILIVLEEVNTNKLISKSGLINGEAFQVTENNISPNSQYEVKIYTRKDPLNQPDLIVEITPLYYESIVWLYWDPLTKSELSAVKNKALVVLDDEDRLYRALEGCRGSPVFHTQVNNYHFNELAFNELLEMDNLKSDRKEKVINEQGLRLSVQFDITAFNKDGSVKLTCEVPSHAVAPLEYGGYKENGNQKAILWNEVQ